jgi:hypothetical protein
MDRRFDVPFREARRSFVGSILQVESPGASLDWEIVGLASQVANLLVHPCGSIFRKGCSMRKAH